MPMLDTMAPEAKPQPTAEPGWPSEIDELFGNRQPRPNAWLMESLWLSTVLSPPAPTIESERIEEPEDTMVLQADEINLEDVSLATGSVEIELSDEQVGRLGLI